MLQGVVDRQPQYNLQIGKEAKLNGEPANKHNS